MLGISAKWKNGIKWTLGSLLAIGTFATALVDINDLRKIIFSSEPEKYDKAWIPIAYADVGGFRLFLERNKGKVVSINSALALDLVLPVNYLVEQQCEMNLPDDTKSENSKAFYTLGLPDFSKDFDEAELNSAVYNEKTGEFDFSSHVLQKIKCLDTLRIELKDPSSFRWSYGGTGTRSLPLSGIFKVTSRAFSGPRIEYTLRQLAE